MVFRILCCTVAVMGLIFGPAAAAQQADSRLEQTIEPIECVYTSTEDGLGSSSSTVCSDMIAPTLDRIAIKNNRQPVLQGTFSSAEMKKLRVWVGGAWYTYGASPYLTVDGDSWSLDLSESAVLLPVGSYTIIVELLTLDSFLLRSVYEDVLSIPPLPATDTPIGGDMGGVGARPIYGFWPRRDGTYIFAPNPLAVDRAPLPDRHTAGPILTYDDISLKTDKRDDVCIWLPLAIAVMLGIVGIVWRFVARRAKHYMLLRKRKKSS